MVACCGACPRINRLIIALFLGNAILSICHVHVLGNRFYGRTGQTKRIQRVIGMRLFFFSNSIIVKFVLNVRKLRTRYTRHRGVGGRFISKISIVDSRLAHVYMCIRNRIDENAEFFFFLTLDVGVLRGCTQFIWMFCRREFLFKKKTWV